MAEDTRIIVYYKSKPYRLEFRGDAVSKIQEENGAVELIVETKNLKTLEEYTEWQSKQRSQHVNWCK